MTKTLRIGQQTRNRKRQIGARMFVAIENARWNAHYEFDTHGLSVEECAAKVQRIEERHTRWSSRMDGFAGVIDVEIALSGRVFRIVDCTIPGRGDGESAELIVGAREVLDGGKLRALKGFPVRRRFDALEAVPTNAEIVADVRQRIEALLEAEAAHESYAAQVTQLVGGG